MDACKYCKGYHHPAVICEGYIDALKKGKIKPPSEKIGVEK